MRRTSPSSIPTLRTCAAASAGADFATDICPESDVEAVQGKDYHNCAISELQVEMVDGEPRGRIIRWAEHAHLSGDAAELTPALPAEMMTQHEE